MRDLEKLREKIQKEQTIQLSSDFTKGGAILGVVISVVAAFFLVPKILNNPDGFQTNMLIAGLLLLVLIFLTFYQLIFAAEAELKGKKLKMKKVIGKEYEVDVSQVEKVSSFQSKSTKYTIVKFKDINGNPEKALILNSNSIIFGKEVTAGEVIKLAQQI